MAARLPGHFVQAPESYKPFANLCVAIGRSKVRREGLRTAGVFHKHRIQLGPCETGPKAASRCHSVLPRLPNLSPGPSLRGYGRHSTVSLSWM